LNQNAGVHSRESKSHLFSGFLALVVDAFTVMAGLKTALHVRFHSGWFAVDPLKGIPTPEEQWRLMCIAGIAFLITFRVLGLYVRPYRGRFEDQIPRMVRGMLLGIMVYFSAQAALQLRPEFSRLALGIAAFTVTGCFLAGRYVL
jgi:hypothetical protein